MLKKALIVFAAVYILLAVMGISMSTQHADGHLLFGTFKLDIVHDLVHLMSGILALVAATASYRMARLYFQVFGVIYAGVAVIGFIQQHTVLGIFSINMADNYLHVVIATSSLALGFLTKKDENQAGPARPRVG